MKQILLIPIIFFALLTTANAEGLYTCIDNNGNEIITSQPQDDMKCQLKETIQKPTPEELADKQKAEKENAKAEKNEDAGKSREEIKARVKKCLSCCSNKWDDCYSFTANSAICNAEDKNCLAMCNSKGASSSAWSCW
jgi:hypothetical protein